MSGTGGSVIGVSIAGRPFSATSDGDPGFDLGGYMAEVEPNGDLSARTILKAKSWRVEGVVISIDDELGDLEFIQAVMNAGVDVDIEITKANNITYSGRGLPVGDLKVSAQSTTAPVDFSGPGVLTP